MYEDNQDEWDRLRFEVINAINKRKASDVDFNNKDLHQCEYQQKCAEIEKSEFPTILSAIIFGLGLGTGLISRFKIDDLVSIIQTIIGFFLIYVVWFIYYEKFYKPGHEACKEIILNAEKQIQKLKSRQTEQDVTK